MIDGQLIEPVPSDLHEALWSAQDELAAKASLIDRLQSQASALDAEAKLAREGIAAERAKYVDGFSKIDSGSEELSPDAKEARSKARALAVEVEDAEETAKDMRSRAYAEKGEFDNALRERDRLRRMIVRHIRSNFPAKGLAGGDLAKLNFETEFSLPDMLLVYLASNYDVAAEAKHPFGAANAHPEDFFRFIARCFLNPSRDEYIGMRSHLDGLIWGEREPPAPIKVPPDAAKKPDGLDHLFGVSRRERQPDV